MSYRDLPARGSLGRNSSARVQHNLGRSVDRRGAGPIGGLSFVPVETRTNFATVAIAQAPEPLSLPGIMCRFDEKGPAHASATVASARCATPRSPPPLCARDGVDLPAHPGCRVSDWLLHCLFLNDASGVKAGAPACIPSGERLGRRTIPRPWILADSDRPSAGMSSISDLSSTESREASAHVTR